MSKAIKSIRFRNKSLDDIMKINKSILIGFLFIIPSIISYFAASTGLASLIAISIGIFFLITGLFETNNFHNKSVYFAIVTIIIAISLILIYTLFSMTSGINLFSAIYLIAVPLILIILAYNFTKEWKLFRNKVISFNSLGLIVIMFLIVLITVIEVIFQYLF